MLRVYVTDPGPGTETEYTALLRADKKFEIGAKVFNGEADQGELLLEDPSGVLDWEVDFAAHRRVRVTEDASGSEMQLLLGRITSKEFDRGTHRADRGRDFTLSIEDANADLAGIIVNNWIRPAESDYARVLALIDAYLAGSSSTEINPEGQVYARPSTTINGYWVLSGFDVALPAETYDATDPLAVLRSIAEFANKRMGVYIEEDFGISLYYAPRDETTNLNCTIGVSDNSADVDDTTYFAPHWLSGPALHTDADELISGALLIHPNGVTYDRREAVEAVHDRWEEALYSTRPVASGVAELGSLLDARVAEQARRQFSIQMPAEMVHLVKAGMRIEVKRAVASAVDASTFYRIVNVRYAWLSSGTTHNYNVIVTLEVPVKLAPTWHRPRPALVQRPVNYYVQVFEDLWRWDFTVDDFDTTSTYDSGLTRVPYPGGYAPAAAFFANDFARSENAAETSRDVLPVTGTHYYRFSMDILWGVDAMFDHRDVFVIWKDGGTLLRTDTWTTEAGHSIDAGYTQVTVTIQAPFAANLVGWTGPGLGTVYIDNILIEEGIPQIGVYYAGTWGPVTVVVADGVSSSYILPFPTRYVAGTLDVRVDGVAQPAIEDNPDTGAFSLSFTPTAGSVITAAWQVPNS